MSATLPTVPPVVCQPWCEQQDGHPDDWRPEDQMCFGPDREVPISGEPPMAWRHDWAERQVLRTYAQFIPAEGVVSIQVGHNDEAGCELTPQEARAFAEALLATVAEVSR